MTLFQCLSIDNVLTLFSALMVERRILLVSDKRPVLFEVAEVLTCITFPFQYQGAWSSN